MYIDILLRLRDAVRRKRPESGEPTVGFGQGILAKNNVTKLEHSHTLLIWLQLIFTCSFD
jgi:hypothetical protein